MRCTVFCEDGAGNFSAEVKLNYLDKAYQVTMSVHQLAILLCFENENSLKMDYLEKATGLSGELLFRNIRALADSNILSTADKAEKEAEHVNITAHQDRKYYMECTIVRIMKTRKVIKHAALVNEVIEQTKSRFVPDMNFIKKSIESLIEKLYIQRTDQHDEYQYLA
ncbi:unnamed protein product [Gongylonema pulchrum]|uniref:CULLIN_2 domain-containing protein n=1 Tax=Gongylonema pulchrum TaxID=637853 RepID=A0A183EDH5_9BILA|nr:unnamed protein product [Gongylonema pulchrum]